MIGFINEFIARLSGENPKFFKALQYIVVILAILSYSTSYVLDKYSIYPILSDILTHLSTACVALALGFKLPNVDKNVL